MSRTETPPPAGGTCDVPPRFDPIAALLALLLAVATWNQVRAAAAWGPESWQMTEWLIHYADGFVRRGLAGSVLLGLSGWTGIQANHLVIATSLACHVTLVAWLLRRATRMLPVAVLLSAMMAGFAPLQDCLVRKDSLGLLCLVGCLAIRDRVGRPWLRIAGVNLIACLAILVHESFAFFGLAALVLAREPDADPSDGIRATLRRGLALLPAVACLGLTARFHGTEETSLAIHRNLMPLWEAIDPASPVPAAPTAAIDAISWTLREGIGLTLPIYRSGPYQSAMWAMVFTTTFVLLLWFARQHPEPAKPLQRRDLARWASLLLFQLACITPLFVLGIDYGRWLCLWTTGAAILAATGRGAPAWFEQRIARAIATIRLHAWLDAIPAQRWILLVFGVPVCWSLRNFLTAGPLVRQLDWLWNHP